MDKREFKEFIAYLKESFLEMGWWGLMALGLYINLSLDWFLAEIGWPVIAAGAAAAVTLVCARAFYERVQAWERRP
ncbi:hypothetical protein A9R16_003460 [Acidiferrobacter thiooxydans]|uniref:hypothetical protein n=1 Tax=Acidiferrobacter thiooxydans TaxID=163359 RepID=UPI0008250E71|nr:hypothetical protein [Acidiferrobacter thiooxydans]UEO00472.1 hypothetical protein A9R16_003460 [Acidiferrobacter thiooxydans]